jgi:hypothetical protein
VKACRDPCSAGRWDSETPSLGRSKSSVGTKMSVDVSSQSIDLGLAGGNSHHAAEANPNGEFLCAPLESSLLAANSLRSGWRSLHLK